MSHSSYYSVVLERAAAEVWEIVRDFNSYPILVNGVDDSHIEADLPGTAVSNATASNGQGAAVAGRQSRRRE